MLPKVYFRRFGGSKIAALEQLLALNIGVCKEKTLLVLSDIDVLRVLFTTMALLLPSRPRSTEYAKLVALNSQLEAITYYKRSKDEFTTIMRMSQTTRKGKLKSWPSLTMARVEFVCISCESDLSRENQKYWHGRIIGKGLHGSVNAIWARAKHKYKLLGANTALMQLLTICPQCCIDLDLHDEMDQSDYVFALKNRLSKPATLKLPVTYKAAEEIFSSRVIVMEGVLMNTIKTIDAGGCCRVWYLLDEPRSFLDTL